MSILMEKFPTFEEYLETQITYEQIINTKKCNPNRVALEKRLTFNAPIYHREEFKINNYPDGWENIFTEAEAELTKALEFINLQIRLGFNVFPEPKNLFKVFNLIRPENIHVIIIGNEPYHAKDKNGIPIANGLSFSCNGDTIQPLLKNIFKEISRTEGDCPKTGNLEFWVKQGVFLINSSLTVNEGNPGSHHNAWKFFIYKILNILFELTDYCFLVLWGNESQKLITGRDKLLFSSNKVMVLTSDHPNLSSFKNGKNPFVGNGHFQTINQILEANGVNTIDWVGKELSEI